jgi:hypothetical protein
MLSVCGLPAARAPHSSWFPQPQKLQRRLTASVRAEHSATDVLMGRHMGKSYTGQDTMYLPMRHWIQGAT